MKILVLGDDSLMEDTVEALVDRGAQVDIAGIDSSFRTIRSGTYDAVLLDCDCLKTHEAAVAFVGLMRQEELNVPLLALSSESEDHSIRFLCNMLSVGADDFVNKTPNIDELHCRLKAIVKRDRSKVEAKIVMGNMTIDLREKRVLVSGRLVKLTGKEYQLLEFLSLHKGSTLHKYRIHSHLSANSLDKPEPEIVEVYICKLRKKLARANNGGHHIHSMGYGVGYALMDEPAVNPNPETVFAEAASKIKFTIQTGHGWQFLEGLVGQPLSPFLHERANQVTDDLTGLYNRAGLISALGPKTAIVGEFQNSEFNVVSIDIKHFKLVNQRYGAVVGDAVLAEIGHVLRQNFSDQEATIARIHGDEVVLVVDVGLDMDGLVDRIQKTLSRVSPEMIAQRLNSAKSANFAHAA